MFGKEKGTLMPKLLNQLPKKCRDRNQCFSWHRGKRIYHGVWGSPDAEKSYKRFIAALLESPAPVFQNENGGEMLISELADAFLEHIETRMDKTHVQHFKRAIGYLVDVYGELTIDDFSPKKLKVCRGQMVKTGRLCRNMVNDYTRRIISVFAWGVEEECVKSALVHSLREVKALRKGEQGTFDNPPRTEVSDDVVKRTLPFMSPTVSAMVQIQRITGMRPSEVYRMTVGNIDRTRDSELWYYTPESHKTERFIGKKPIPLGKPEQILITPYLEGKTDDEAVFSPRTAMREWHAERRANRKTKLTPSQQERNRQRAANPAENVGEFYDHSSYRKAIDHAIQKGNKVLPESQKIPSWTPYALRHAAGTAVEKALGLDKAQALLGHTSANTTKRYAHGQLAIAESMAQNRHNPFAEVQTLAEGGPESTMNSSG
jgi:integrase